MKASAFHPSLESLRGCASVAVVLIHCVLAWGGLLAGDPPAAFVSDALRIPLSADAPVTLFFVLSGFVLAGALARLGASRRALAAYALRRLLRIVPAAWAALLVTVAVFPLFALWPQHLAGAGYWIAESLDAVRLANLPASLLFWDDRINPMYWSLQVELAGSLLMPLLCLLMRGRRPALALGLAVALLALLPLVPLEVGPLGYLSSSFLFCFGLGALAFHVVDRHPQAAARLFSPRAALPALALLALAHDLVGPSAAYGEVFGHSDWLEPILGEGANIDLHAQHLLEGAASAVLVGSLAAPPGTWPGLETAASRFAGRISYSLYVVHFPVIVASLLVLRASMGGALFAHLWAAPFLAMALVLPASVAAAVLLHLGVERPAMALGRRLAARWLTPREGLFTEEPA